MYSPDDLLTSLFFPVPIQSFVTDYWEKQPLYIERADQSSPYPNLLKYDDVESVLFSGELDTSDIRLAQAGDVVDIERLVKGNNSQLKQTLDRRKILSYYHSGATVILQRLDRRHTPLGFLATELAKLFKAKVWTNVYVTPQSSQGFGAHYDTHDVFVLQIYGDKSWVVQGKAVENPLPEQLGVEVDENEPVLIETKLTPGDLLYLPRGFVHQAATNETLSIHITVGLQTLTVSDVLTESVRKATRSDPALRASVFTPLEPMDAVLKHLQNRLDEAMSQLVSHDSALSSSVTDAMERKIGDQLHTKTQYRLHDDTPLSGRNTSFVRLKLGMQYVGRVEAERYIITVNGRDLSMPIKLQKLINYLLSGELVAVPQLAQYIEGQALTRLLNTLSVEGLIESVDDNSDGR